MSFFGIEYALQEEASVSSLPSALRENGPGASYCVFLFIAAIHRSGVGKDFIFAAEAWLLLWAFKIMIDWFGDLPQ